MNEGQKKLDSAYWTSNHSGIAVLSKDWTESDLPPLFYMPGKRSLRDIRQASPLTYAKMSGFFMRDQWIVFILTPDHHQGIEWENNTFYVGGEFNRWGEAIGKKTWELTPTEIEGERYYTLRLYRQDFKEQSFPFKFVTGEGQWLDLPTAAPNAVYDHQGVRNHQIDPHRTGYHLFTFSLSEPESLDRQGKLLWSDSNYEEEAPITHRSYFLQKQAEHPLGAIVTDKSTTFRVFSPRAKSVAVTFFENLDNPEYQTLPLERVDDTTWEGVHPANLHRYYYYYSVAGSEEIAYAQFEPSFKILDPYALAAVGPAGPGIVWDRRFCQPLPGDFDPPDWHDLVIVEGHLRDLVELAPIPLKEKERHGFTGLKKWVESEGFYLKSLGVNALELQPIQQFDLEDPASYQWGYMPTHYFSPHAGYAQAPEHGSQIREFQELVTACHRQGLALIIDVVYNHVGDPNHLLHLDKQYYFELDEDGSLMNWSGTGNTLRCHTPMGQHLIVESLIHFLTVYKVDGFRFDLAELIGLRVLKEIEVALKKVNPKVILIAEPWSFRGHIAHALKKTGFAFWNDGYREFIRHYLLGRGDTQGIRYYLSGCLDYLTAWPAQSVNYVESHDDYCWLDRITENLHSDGSQPTPNDRRRTHLMAAVLMVSLGIPMLSAGQDLLRSKRGVSNTYLRGDLNFIDYERAIHYSGTQAYFRQWIRFRLSPAGAAFRLRDRPSPGFLRFFGDPKSSAVAALYNADCSLPSQRLLFAINPHEKTAKITLEALDASTWKQIADHERFAENGLESAYFRVVDKVLQLPPLTCGLWVEDCANINSQ